MGQWGMRRGLMVLFGGMLCFPLNLRATSSLDLGPDYQNALDTIYQQPRPQDSSQVCLVFVRGFLSDLIATDKLISLRRDYFDSQIKDLKRWGFSCLRVVPIESEADTWTNQVLVKNSILDLAAEGKKALLITHSKGGVDVLEALITDRVSSRQLLPMIRGWIALQTPFYGSPAADWLIQGRSIISPKWARFLLWLFGGSFRSIESLTPERRNVVMSLYDSEIHEMISSFPMISVASEAPSINQCRGRIFDKILGEHLRAFFRAGIPSDGLVPLDSMVIPGSHYLLLNGVDHAATVMDPPCSDPSFDRKALLRFLLLKVLAATENTACRQY